MKSDKENLNGSDLEDSKNSSKEDNSEKSEKESKIKKKKNKKKKQKDKLKYFSENKLQIIKETILGLNIKELEEKKEDLILDNNLMNKFNKAKSISIINKINDELDEINVNISNKLSRKSFNKNKHENQMYNNNINNNSFRKNLNTLNENERVNTRFISKNSRLSNTNNANLNNPFDNNLYKNNKNKLNKRDEELERDLLRKYLIYNLLFCCFFFNNFFLYLFSLSILARYYTRNQITESSINNPNGYKVDKKTKEHKNSDSNNPYRNHFDKGIYQLNPLDTNPINSDNIKGNYFTNGNLHSTGSNNFIKITNEYRKEKNFEDKKRTNKFDNSLHESMISKKEEYEHYLNTISDRNSKENFPSAKFKNKEENNFIREEKNLKNFNSINKLRTIDDLYKHNKKPFGNDDKQKVNERRNSEYDFYQNKNNNYINNQLNTGIQTIICFNSFYDPYANI